MSALLCDIGCGRCRCVRVQKKNESDVHMYHAPVTELRITFLFSHDAPGQTFASSFWSARNDSTVASNERASYKTLLPLRKREYRSLVRTDHCPNGWATVGIYVLSLSVSHRGRAEYPYIVSGGVVVLVESSVDYSNTRRRVARPTLWSEGLSRIV